MLFQLCVIVIVKALAGRVLDGRVHPFDLAIGPRVLHLCQAMLDTVLVADPVEDVIEGIFMPLLIGKLNAVVAGAGRWLGQNSMDGVGYGFDQIAQELRGIHLSGFGIEFNEGKF